eukprot:s1640_g7.t2
MQLAVTYTLLAKDHWCDNLGGAHRLGEDFNGYSLVGCQTQCSKDRLCAYISFNQNDGWCSKYATCGVPTTMPNEFPQDDPRGWLTFARDSVEAVPQFYGDCSQHDFQVFKNRSSAWYGQRVASLRLFHDMTLLVNNFHTIYSNCPPAALLAVLLKLESMYFEDDEKWNTLLEIYVNTHHKASAEGELLPQHYQDGWPLREGIGRALQLRKLGTKQRSVELVVCYCSEKLSWLRAFHQLPWRDEDRSKAVRENVALRFYHKCGGLGQAARRLEAQTLQDQWASSFREVSVRYVDDVLRADDDSAYLAFIVDRYDTLPDYTVFLHADAPEHVPSLELLTDSVFAAIRGFLPENIGFVHFAHNYVLHDLGCRDNPDCEGHQLDPEFGVLWKKVFGSSIAPSLAAGDVNAYCCVQFMVHRDRIRLRPPSFYQHGWEYFGLTAESYHRLFPVGRVVRKLDVLGRTPGQLAMYIWHVMFGEALRLPRRQRDVRLPLFMKIQNVEVEAIEEDGESSQEELEQLAMASQVLEGGGNSIAARLGTLFE